MARKENEKKLDRKYEIERINRPMSREELKQLTEQLKSDDDFVNYHLDTISKTHARYSITIVNSDNTNPLKNAANARAHDYFKKDEAEEFINDYIDKGLASSKPKEVMRTGYSRRSIDAYNKLVAQEKKESKIVSEFTKPSFDDVMDNVYVNPYNGDAYKMTDNEIPAELRDNVGVIIPGLIDTEEEYFEFVRKLKDRGKEGLGRVIYDKYEDYLNALDILETYTNAVYSKYSKYPAGHEEFDNGLGYYEAKELGGIFGGYEYIPTVKPRFKKTARNIRLSKGLNVGGYSEIKDMGRRIRESLAEEIDSIEVNHDYNIVDIVPPNFKDLPETLKYLYKKATDNKTLLDVINRKESYEAFVNRMILQGSPEQKDLGYKLLEELKYEEYSSKPSYESNFADMLNKGEKNINSVIHQLEYDKLLYETNYDVELVDRHVKCDEEEKAYKEFVKNVYAERYGLNSSDILEKEMIEKAADYATNYMFNPAFRKAEDDRNALSSNTGILYGAINRGGVSFGEKGKTYNNETKLQSYLKEMTALTKDAITKMTSNADVDDYRSNKPTMAINDIVGADDKYGNKLHSFDLSSDPKELVKYVMNHSGLAKKIYEIESDVSADGIFGDTVKLEDFVNKATQETKPIINDEVLNDIISKTKNRRGGNKHE